MKLFISYSRDDKAWVYELWRDLRDRAFHDAWIDQRLVPAQDWWETILQNIETCECCIYVMTPQSVASIYCRAEIDYAVALNKPILPLMLKTCDYPDNLRKMHLQYQVIKDEMNLGDVLFIIERAMGEIREGRVMGKYLTSQPSPPRPDEPKPEQTSEQVLEVFMLAEEAASENNVSLAERLFQQVAEADPQGYGPAATQRLEEMHYERARQSDYERISQMVNDPTLKRGARTLWNIFVQKYDADYDPKGLADALREQPPVIESKPKTPEPPIPKEPIPPAVRIQPHEVQQPVKQETNSVKEIVLPPLREAAPIEGARGSSRTWAAIAAVAAIAIIAVFFLAQPFRSPTPDLTATYSAIQQTEEKQHILNVNLTATARAQIPLGSPGNPVTSNTQWTPVIQDFDGVTMVRVPAGCFNMGSNDQDEGKPIHVVCLTQPFWIDKYEVTNEQFNRMMGKAASSSRWADAQRPRDSITWIESDTFCRQRNAQLPTEAQWEYAARGPQSLIYPWGNTFQANNVVYIGSSDNQTANVGSKLGGVSWVGAYDLSGNLNEWVGDWYNADYYRNSPPNDPTGPTIGEGRLLRGGAWNQVDAVMRAATRAWMSPTLGSDDVGFRCARSE
jgi:formylglycine-generating enzyme required for sulfatase activity